MMKPPLLEEDTPYFPIRRALNESQYTLGRTFLQEAEVQQNLGRNCNTDRFPGI